MRRTVLFAVTAALLLPTAPAAADPRFDFAMKVWQHKGMGVAGKSAWQAGHDRHNRCEIRSVSDSHSDETKVEKMRVGDTVLFRRGRVFRLGGFYTVTETGPCAIRVVGEADNDPVVYLTPA